MKKYFLIAAAIHGILFINLNNSKTLGDENISVKKNIPISYNVKSSAENISGIKSENLSQKEETSQIKTEEQKQPEKKEIPEAEFKSRMSKESRETPKPKQEKIKKDIKEVKKENINKNKKSENKKDNSKEQENKNIENKDFTANSDGTYTAVTSKGINFEIIKEVSPNYPRQAEMAGYRKTVVVEAKFLVGTTGEVEDIKIIKSHEKFGFDKEVIQALKKWKFKPIIYKGKNIKVYFNKEFVFTPKK